MRAPYTQLYLHCVWATWDRLPLLTPGIERHVRACILAKCQELKCVPLKLGGIEDHLHLLVRLHTTVAVATLVKEVKGASSHLVTHEIAPGEFFGRARMEHSLSPRRLCQRRVNTLSGNENTTRLRRS